MSTFRAIQRPRQEEGMNEKSIEAEEMAKICPDCWREIGVSTSLRPPFPCLANKRRTLVERLIATAIVDNLDS